MAFQYLLQYQYLTLQWYNENQIMLVLSLFITINFEMIYQTAWGSFISYIRKIFLKTNICYSLIRTPTWTYQGVRNVNFSEYFAYILHEYSYTKNSISTVSKVHETFDFDILGYGWLQKRFVSKMVHLLWKRLLQKRASSLVVGNLRSETKGSRFKSGS